MYPIQSTIHHHNKHPLPPIDTTYRFELVCCVFSGQSVPKTVKGNSYALIIVVHLSKWPEILTLPDMKATTIAQAIFDNWICRYGVMKRLHRDGAQLIYGTEFKTHVKQKDHAFTERRYII